MGEQIDVNEDIWDDTLLIKAYEKSINLSKNELAKRLAQETNSQQNHQPAEGIEEQDDNDKDCPTNTENYKIGDYIRATYDDGIDYEAKITSINEDEQTCTLKYIGYGNEQIVKLSDLVPSWGKKARKIQYNKSKQSNDDLDYNIEGVTNNYDKYSKKSKLQYSNQHQSNTERYSGTTTANAAIPPPPPMPPMLNDLGDDSENLSAMLMSWYMSGYYTGLYHGQKITKNKTKK